MLQQTVPAGAATHDGPEELVPAAYQTPQAAPPPADNLDVDDEDDHPDDNVFDPGDSMKAFVLSFLNGMAVLKFGRLSMKAPQKRLLWLDATSEDLTIKWGYVELGIENPEAEQVQLGEVTYVSAGLVTPTLKRSGKAASANKYWSLHLAERTLDFEAASQQERDFIVTNFRTIIQNVAVLQQTMLFVYNHGLWHPQGAEPIDGTAVEDEAEAGAAPE